MTKTDYIPSNDSEFNAFQANLISKAEENAILWEIPMARITAMKAEQLVWDAAYKAALIKANRNPTEVKVKNDVRVDYETKIRKFTKENLAYNSKVTDGDRTMLGLHNYSDIRTASPVPTTFPVGRIDNSVRFKHKLIFFDVDTPSKKAKPDYVIGLEIWMKKGGDPPVKTSEMSYLSIATKTPFLIDFDDEDKLKVIHYRLRWINPIGKQGPWSAIFSEIVIG